MSKLRINFDIVKIIKMDTPYRTWETKSSIKLKSRQKKPSERFVDQKEIRITELEKKNEKFKIENNDFKKKTL